MSVLNQTTHAGIWSHSLFTESDIVNFKNGSHYRLYNHFGSHSLKLNGQLGTYFSVWAPNAIAVSVVGNFNQWNPQAHILNPRWDKSGIWEGFIPAVGIGEIYKYHIRGYQDSIHLKADPFAHYSELRPKTASITWDLDYTWEDKKWMRVRKKKNSLEAPWSIYELHLASWQRPNKYDEESYNSYQDIAERLVPYIKELGFTHVEFMPIMEYPFDGSWGYQITGFFAPTSRFGDPQGLMYLIDQLHQADIGVILDWVPSHFPHDAHGLFLFDGAHTYEYADRRKGYHPDWNSYIFNYGRGEVKSFLISSACFWFDYFHVDGIRVDAVSSILKLNYSREDGEWEPNQYGGNGNLEAIQFLKDLNETIYRDFPDVQTMAEEATDWPGISRPTFQDGIGFGMKWMMGWMHDTLKFFKSDPIYRSQHQDTFSFSMMYYYDENFLLPLSHDEVVHGKSPLIYKMPGDEWQKFANLRLLYAYMWTHPGAKLLFMGGEFGQTNEWDYRSELNWGLLQYPIHQGLKNCVSKLNELLRSFPALYELQYSPDGFKWVDLSHRNESVVVYRRISKKGDSVYIILNMTPVVRNNWDLELNGKLKWEQIFNSDDASYGGSGFHTNASIPIEVLSRKEKRVKVTLQLPALSAILLA
ncbi:MAG: 1,4-alpha-glucan branching protein GlgB [Chitinophagaceae bacterium]|nr:1,4-alpha-glucan branching protein GlgB [Chitinophagaceae bacterium]NDB52991.1 1,4-alpha-glucan branching protein GlgB [Chitinophagaceae bacterium]